MFGDSTSRTQEERPFDSRFLHCHTVLSRLSLRFAAVSGSPPAWRASDGALVGLSQVCRPISVPQIFNCIKLCNAHGLGFHQRLSCVLHFFGWPVVQLH
jgi:hypothetical protein